MCMKSKNALSILMITHFIYDEFCVLVNYQFIIGRVIIVRYRYKVNARS